jgi:hypothetical protein
MSEFCFKCCLPLVSFLDSNIVVSLSNIQFGEYVCTTQVGNELCNEWKWILVLHHMAVKPPVVLYWSQFAILLLYKEEWRCVWRFGGANVSLLLHVDGTCRST